MSVVSVVVPVFNNEGSLRETCEKTIEIFEQAFSDIELELIFVDDGSRDGSWAMIEALHADYGKYVVPVRLARNFGQIGAMYAGYETSRGDAVITVSADLQDPLELMQEMVTKWREGSDIVIAYRIAREDKLSTSWTSKIAYWFAKKSNPNIPAGGFDFLLMSRRALDVLRTFKGRHRFFQGDVLWAGFPTLMIPYKRVKRTHGKSGWSFSKRLKYFVDLMIDSSYLPIRLMSFLGVMTAFSGLIYACIIVFYWLLGKTPFEGWAPLMIALLLIGGAIMSMMGIIGEYIWRMHDDIKGRPQFIIMDKGEK